MSDLWVIVNSRTFKRAYHNKELTPVFDRVEQAFTFIGKYMGDSPYIIPRRIKKNE